MKDIVRKKETLRERSGKKNLKVYQVKTLEDIDTSLENLFRPILEIGSYICFYRLFVYNAT